MTETLANIAIMTSARRPFEGRAEGERDVTNRSIWTDSDETLEALDQEKLVQKMQPQRRWINRRIFGLKR